MIFKRLVLVPSFLLLATTSFADLKSDWQKTLDKYVVLNKNRDMKGLDAFIKDNFAPDFKFTPKKGQSMNRDQWIKQTHEEANMTGKITKVVFHIDSVKMMSKEKGLCKVSIVFEGSVSMDPKGKPSTIRATSKTDQVMVMKGGKWWIQSMTNTEESLTMDGKPVKG